MIRNTLFVTFPRSGHHLLIDCLQEYFGDEMRYCENYHHCNSIPCTDEKTNVQKTHDFDLDLRHDGQLVIVQTRAKEDAIQSWIELARAGRTFPEERYSEWKRDKEVFYDRWNMKWCTNNSFPVVSYEWFTTHPEYTLVGVIRTMTGEDNVDTSRVEEIVKKFEIKPRRWKQ